jgi:hypothetical protein
MEGYPVFSSSPLLPLPPAGGLVVVVVTVQLPDIRTRKLQVFLRMKRSIATVFA